MATFSLTLTPTDESIFLEIICGETMLEIKEEFSFQKVNEFKDLLQKFLNHTVDDLSWMKTNIKMGFRFDSQQNLILFKRKDRETWVLALTEQQKEQVLSTLETTLKML